MSLSPPLSISFWAWADRRVKSTHALPDVRDLRTSGNCCYKSPPFRRPRDQKKRRLWGREWPQSAQSMKVDLGQNVRLVVSLWRFVVSSFRHVVFVVLLWRFVVSARRFLKSTRRITSSIRRLVCCIVSSFHRFVMSFRRFVMSFRRFDSSTQRGYNSTYITWSVYLTPCTYTWRIYS